MAKKKEFPTFWVIILVLAIVWFLGDMGWLGLTFKFPWLAAIVVIVAIGAIINHSSCCETRKK